jgi:hypothetical protein
MYDILCISYIVVKHCIHVHTYIHLHTKHYIQYRILYIQYLYITKLSGFPIKNQFVHKIIQYTGMNFGLAARHIKFSMSLLYV